MSNLDFLTQATKDKLSDNSRTEIFTNKKSKEEEKLDLFKAYFLRLPKEFREGLLQEAKTAIEEEDRQKEGEKNKQAERDLKSAPIVFNQKALDVKNRLREKLLRKKGIR